MIFEYMETKYPNKNWREENGSFYVDDVEIDTSDYEQWVAENKAVFDAKNKIEAIGTHIYSMYPEKKQSQDRGYQAYAQTVIVGLSPQLGKPVTLDELTIDVMQAVIGFFDGKLTVDTYIADKPEPLKEHYAKLLKIGVRLRWTKACIDEGKAAMADNREPNYPAFPNFEKGWVQS